MNKKKIGLFFGTYNPIHNGHLIMANYVLEHTDLDEIRFVVSPDSPFKEHKHLLPFEKRLSIINIATKNCKSIGSYGIEKVLPKPTYTINTLNYLKDKLGDKCEFTLILGADNLTILDRFYKADEILSNFRVFICQRNGIDTFKYIDFIANKFIDTGIHGLINIPNTPNIELSSTFIRNEVLSGKSIKYYVPESVEQIIKEEYLSLDRDKKIE